MVLHQHLSAQRWKGEGGDHVDLYPECVCGGWGLSHSLAVGGNTPSLGASLLIRCVTGHSSTLCSSATLRSKRGRGSSPPVEDHEHLRDEAIHFC